jgi:hypothetical protein
MEFVSLTSQIPKKNSNFKHQYHQRIKPGSVQNHEIQNPDTIYKITKLQNPDRTDVINILL